MIKYLVLKTYYRGVVKEIINLWFRVLSNESKVKTVRVIYLNASVQMITIKEAKAWLVLLVSVSYTNEKGKLKEMAGVEDL